MLPTIKIIECLFFMRNSFSNPPESYENFIFKAQKKIHWLELRIGLKKMLLLWKIPPKLSDLAIVFSHGLIISKKCSSNHVHIVTTVLCLPYCIYRIVRKSSSGKVLKQSWTFLGNDTVLKSEGVARAWG
jgi:hypothetical protein